MDKNLNTDFTENTDLAFSLIFLVGKCFLDFYQDFCGFASAWALPFLCWLQSLSFSNLSWPSQREGISYSTLSKTSSANYFSQSLQPPLVLPRRGDAGYSGSVKDRLMLVALVVDKSLTIRRLQANNNIANGICPSPSGEVRWGLMTIGRVTCSFPWGRSGWVILRGRLGGGWCRYAE